MKLLLHLIFGLLAFACLVLCVAGISWVWVLKKPVTEKATYAFDKAVEWLIIADKTVTDVKGNLEVARTNLQVVQSNSGDAGKKPNHLQKMTAQVAVSQFFPNVHGVQQNLERVTEASVVINSLLETLQDNPIESLDKLDTDQVRNLQGQLGSVTNATMELSNLLNDGPTNEGEDARAKSDRMANSLNTIITLANGYQAQVRALHTRVDRARTRTLFWMGWTPTIVTVALSWVAVSQLVVLVVVGKTIFRKDATT